MWDDDQRALSLRAPAKHFKAAGSTKAANFAATVENHATDRDAHLNTIKLRWNKIVAHRAKNDSGRSGANGVCERTVFSV
ncbi:MAG: hypothetical protein EKK71_12430 [Candidatus Competibacteraceae bacterium]|nr:MAG: hypothetical protein EKK71_12430 [Candidatus Competibacteraceae bacterium]